MAQRDASSAEDQADAHERSSPNPYTEHYMDLHNNRVGRKIGAAHPDATHKQVADLIKKELVAGGLITDINKEPSTSTKPAPKSTLSPHP